MKAMDLDPQPTFRQHPLPPLPRESTAEMVHHISRELVEIEQAMVACRSAQDRQAEARLTGSWLAHLLISSDALLHNLLIDTAQRPRRIGPERQSSSQQTPDA